MMDNRIEEDQEPENQLNAYMLQLIDQIRMLRGAVPDLNKRF